MLRALACIAIAACSQTAARSQSTAAQTVQETEVVTSKLSPPIYPPIAKAARVSGNVELTLNIRPDNTVESVAVVSGPPMLLQAAIDSARQTGFECKGCSDPSTPFRITYNFVLSETGDCGDTEGSPNSTQPDKSYPQVTQSGTIITITDRAVLLCDPSADRIRARSAKCLFLWKCGWRS